MQAYFRNRPDFFFADSKLESVLGWEGSNLRMAESKSAALPLGYIPIVFSKGVSPP